jgi:hypothetical protein
MRSEVRISVDRLGGAGGARCRRDGLEWAQERFRGHARPIGALAAEELLLDEGDRDLGVEPPERRRERLARRAAAEDDDTGISLCHGRRMHCSCSIAPGRRTLHDCCVRRGDLIAHQKEQAREQER